MRAHGKGSSQPIPPHFQSPDALLRELGIEEPADIHIEAIAQHCGATVLYEEMEGSEARLIGYGKRAFITVNNRSVVPRQRFSAAHELGHWMWDRGKAAYACGGEALSAAPAKGGQNPERRANRYATDLLLPKEMFFREMNGRAPSLRAIEGAAAVFRTSLSATAIRWVELDPNPVLLVCYGPKGRLWWAKSSNISGDVKLKKIPDKLSAAHELLTTDHVYAESNPLEGSFWLENVDDKAISVTEESVRLSSEMVLTLLHLEGEG